MLAKANKGKKIGRGFGKNAGEWTGRVEISKEEIPGSKRGKEDFGEMKLSRESRNSWLEVKHAKLCSDLLQALKREHFTALSSCRGEVNFYTSFTPPPRRERRRREGEREREREERDHLCE